MDDRQEWNGMHVPTISAISVDYMFDRSMHVFLILSCMCLLWSDSVSKGHAFGTTNTDVEMWTKHKNIIMNVQVIPDASGSATKFTTSGIDGRVIFWDVSSLKLKA